MTSGRYLLSDHDGPYAVEDFTCAQEATGWRYRATRSDPRGGVAIGGIELLVGPAGEVLRLEVTSGAWALRGGVVGGEALWRRGEDERSVPAHGFTGTSPAYAVVAIRLAAARSTLTLVEVHDAALATRVVEQSWTGGEGRWTSVQRDTGEVGQWLLTDGVVAQGPGLALVGQ